MPSARLRHERESFESLLRRFKRAVEKDGTLQEVRNREHYEKPSSIRKRAKAAARKRHQKQVALERMSPTERKRYEQQLAKKTKGRRGKKRDDE